MLAGIPTVRTTGIGMRAAVVLALCCRGLFSVQDAREREREGRVTKSCIRSVFCCSLFYEEATLAGFISLGAWGVLGNLYTKNDVRGNAQA